MPTFGFNKPIDDIEDPVLLPEDWYTFRVSKDPTIEDNKKAKDGLSGEEGAGKNLVVKLTTVSDDPEFNGRMLTIWLPYPSEHDESQYDGIGQKKSDAKMQRIIGFVEAFGGRVGVDDL